GAELQAISGNGLFGSDGAWIERTLSPERGRRRPEATFETGPGGGRRARALQGATAQFLISVDRRFAGRNGVLRRSVHRRAAHGSKIHSGFTCIGEGAPSS